MEKTFKTIHDCAAEVHKTLGLGLLESAYEACLFYELNQTSLKVEKQKPLPLIYKDIKPDIGYRIGLLVEDSIIVEIKSVECLNDIHLAQILTYMKLNNCRLGLLVNFNVKYLKDGIKRVINS